MKSSPVLNECLFLADTTRCTCSPRGLKNSSSHMQKGWKFFSLRAKFKEKQFCRKYFPRCFQLKSKQSPNIRNVMSAWFQRFRFFSVKNELTRYFITNWLVNWEPDLKAQSRQPLWGWENDKISKSVKLDIQLNVRFTLRIWPHEFFRQITLKLWFDITEDLESN